jgi:hypothetical protein
MLPKICPIRIVTLSVMILMSFSCANEEVVDQRGANSNGEIAFYVDLNVGGFSLMEDAPNVEPPLTVKLLSGKLSICNLPWEIKDSSSGTVYGPTLCGAIVFEKVQFVFKGFPNTLHTLDLNSPTTISDSNGNTWSFVKSDTASLPSLVANFDATSDAGVVTLSNKMFRGIVKTDPGLGPICDRNSPFSISVSGFEVVVELTKPIIDGQEVDIPAGVTLRKAGAEPENAPIIQVLSSQRKFIVDLSPPAAAGTYEYNEVELIAELVDGEKSSRCKLTNLKINNQIQSQNLPKMTFLERSIKGLVFQGGGFISDDAIEFSVAEADKSYEISFLDITTNEDFLTITVEPTGNETSNEIKRVSLPDEIEEYRKYHRLSYGIVRETKDGQFSEASDRVEFYVVEGDLLDSPVRRTNANVSGSEDFYEIRCAVLTLKSQPELLGIFHDNLAFNPIKVRSLAFNPIKVRSLGPVVEEFSRIDNDNPGTSKFDLVCNLEITFEKIAGVTITQILNGELGGLEIVKETRPFSCIVEPGKDYCTVPTTLNVDNYDHPLSSDPYPAFIEQLPFDAVNVYASGILNATHSQKQEEFETNCEPINNYNQGVQFGFSSLQLDTTRGLALIGRVPPLNKFLKSFTYSFPHVCADRYNAPVQAFDGDGYLFIPKDLSVSLSGERTINVPVKYKVTNPNGVSLCGSNARIRFDHTALTVNGNNPAEGITLHTGGPCSINTLAKDTIVDVFNISFTVNQDAPVGGIPINLLSVYSNTPTASFDFDLNELTNRPAATNAEDDFVDGLITVGP